MLSGCKDALEVGCGDGFGAELVRQEVPVIHAVDFDPLFIENCKLLRAKEGLSFGVADLTLGPVLPERDGFFSLDVLEHIHKEKEDAFMRNAVDSLRNDGVCIIGMLISAFFQVLMFVMLFSAFGVGSN